MVTRLLGPFGIGRERIERERDMCAHGNVIGESRRIGARKLGGSSVQSPVPEFTTIAERGEINNFAECVRLELQLKGFSRTSYKIGFEHLAQ